MEIFITVGLPWGQFAGLSQLPKFFIRLTCSIGERICPALIEALHAMVETAFLIKVKDLLFFLPSLQQ